MQEEAPKVSKFGGVPVEENASLPPEALPNPEAIRSVAEEVGGGFQLDDRELQKTHTSLELQRRGIGQLTDIDGPLYEAYAQSGGFKGDVADDNAAVIEAHDAAARSREDASLIVAKATAKEARQIGGNFLASMGAENFAAAIQDDDGIDPAVSLARSLAGGAVQSAGRGSQGVVAMDEAFDRRLEEVYLSILPDSIGNVFRRSGRSPLGPQAEMSKLVRPLVEKAGAKVEKLGKAIDVPDEDRTILNDIAGALGQVFVQATVTILNPALGIAQMAGEGGEHMERRTEALGADGTPEGDAAVLLGGVATAALEKIQMGKLLSRTPYLGKLVKTLPDAIQKKWFGGFVDMAAAGAGEAVQETVEGAVNDAIALAAFDPDVEFFEEWEREAIAAGGAGAIFRAMLSMVRIKRAGLEFAKSQKRRDLAQEITEKLKSLEEDADQAEQPAEAQKRGFFKELGNGEYSKETFKALSNVIENEKFAASFETAELRALAMAALDGDRAAQDLLRTFSELSKVDASILDVQRLQKELKEIQSIPDFELAEDEIEAFKEFDRLDPAKFLTEQERAELAEEQEVPLTPEEEAQLEAEFRAEEAEQALLETVDFDNEILAVVRRKGGIPMKDPVLQGEIDRVRENLKATKAATRIVTRGKKDLDKFRESVNEEGGFEFDTIHEMLEAIAESAGGTEVFPVQGGGIYRRARQSKVKQPKLSRPERIRVEKAKVREKFQKRIDDLKAKFKATTDRMREKALSKQFDVRIAAAKRLQREKNKRVSQIRKMVRERDDVTMGIRALERLVSTLPLPIRGKFRGFGTFASKKTRAAKDRHFEKAIEKVDSLFEQFISAELKKRFREVAGKFDATSASKAKKIDLRITPEGRKKVAFAIKAAKMGRAEALAKASELGDKAREPKLDEDGKLVNQKEFDEYGMLVLFGGVLDGDASARRISAAFAALRELIATGKSQAELFVERRNAEVEDMKLKSIKAILGKEEPMAENFLREAEGKMGWLGKLKGRIRNFAVTRLDSFETMLSNVSSDATRFSGYLVRTFHARTFQADQDEKAKVRADLDRLTDDVLKALGLPDKPKGKDLRKVVKMLKSWSEIKSGNVTGIEYIHNGVKTRVPMSEWQAISLWMQWQDKSLAPTFEKMEIDATTIEAVEAFIGPEGIAAAKSILEGYRRIGEQVQDRVEEVDGYRPIFIENYSPIKRMRTTTDEESREATSEGFVKATEKNSNLKHRMKTTSELRFDNADRVFVEYVNNMGHYLAWAQVAKDINAVLMDEEVARAFRQKTGGTEYRAILKDLVDDMLRGATDKNATSELAAKWIANIAVGKLAFNLTSAIKQLASIPAYVDSIPATAFAKGLADFWMHPSKNIETLRKTKYIQNRIKQSYDRDLRKLAEKTEALQIADVRNFRDKMMFLTRYGDLGANFAGGWSVYKYHYDKAIADEKIETEAEARAIAESEFARATDRAQQSALIQSLSAFQRGGSWAKLFTMFMTSPIQYFRITTNAVIAARAGRISNIEAAKTVFIFHVLLPQIFTAMGSAFIGFWTDDEEVEEGFMRRQLQALVVGNINSIFLVGEAWDMFWQMLIHDDSTWGAAKLTIPLLDELENVVHGAVGLAIEDSEEIMDNADQLASGLMSLVGVPYGPLSDNIEGIVDASTGKTDHPMLRVMGFTEWALFEKEQSSSRERRRSTQRRGNERRD